MSNIRTFNLFNNCVYPGIFARVNDLLQLQQSLRGRENLRSADEMARRNCDRGEFRSENSGNLFDKVGVIDPTRIKIIMIHTQYDFFP